MTVAPLMDVHVRRAVTLGLRRRGVDVLTAQEEGVAEISDSELLDHATRQNRVLFTQDSDLLAEADHRQEHGIRFAGVIYARQNDVSTGQAVRDLELIAKAYDLSNMENRVEYLPL